MSSMTVLAWFTKSTGDLPGTGLTLADIDVTLTAIHRTTGAETAIWNTENPAFEVDNVGAYGKIGFCIVTIPPCAAINAPLRAGIDRPLWRKRYLLDLETKYASK